MPCAVRAISLLASICILCACDAPNVIGPQGGVYEHPSGVRVEVPQGAVDEEVTFEVVVAASYSERVLDESVPVAPTEQYEISAGGAALRLPVRIWLPRPSQHNIALRGGGPDGWVTFRPEEPQELPPDFATVQTQMMGTFGTAQQVSAGPPSAPTVLVCEFFVPHNGAADVSSQPFLCDETGQSYHIRAARFPMDYNLSALATSAGVGMVDLNIDEAAEDFGVAYAWVDSEFVGTLPAEIPELSCQGCGLPCPDWSTLVLAPGVHTLRVETFDTASCTAYFTHSDLICGGDFTPAGSVTARYDGTFTVGLGACSSIAVTPTPIPSGPSGVQLTTGFWGYSVADSVDAFYVDYRFLSDGTAKVYSRRYNPDFDHGCPSSPDGGVYNDSVSLVSWTQAGDVVTVGTIEMTIRGDELVQTSPSRILRQFSEPQTPGPCAMRTGAPAWP